MIQYADDIAMYTITRDLIEAKLELSIKRMGKKLNDLGLEIESSKTNIIIFNNRKDKIDRIILRIKGKRIRNVMSARFLEIEFDSKIKFDRH